MKILEEKIQLQDQIAKLKTIIESNEKNETIIFNSRTDLIDSIPHLKIPALKADCSDNESNDDFEFVLFD